MEKLLFFRTNDKIDSDPTFSIVSPLDPHSACEFFSRTWKYSLPTSKEAIKELLRLNPSCGVFVDGELVCGEFVNGVGYMGMLFTLEEHRGRGYAKIVTTTLINSAIDHGMVPACAIEMKNIGSQRFHEKLGMRCSHLVDLITVRKSEF